MGNKICMSRQCELKETNPSIGDTRWAPKFMRASSRELNHPFGVALQVPI